MKNLFLISCLSLLLASCSTTKTISQSDIEKPISDTIECSYSSINKVILPITNGKEISSNRKYCYVWQLEKQDKTVLMTQTGISSNTNYVSWLPNSVLNIRTGDPKYNQSVSGINLYKFTNENNFSVISEKIQVKSFFHLEQLENEIYVSLVNEYAFKNNGNVYLNKDFQINKNFIKIKLANNLKLKLGETVLIQVPSPYIDDNNKFYLLKFKINAFD